MRKTELKEGLRVRIKHDKRKEIARLLTNPNFKSAVLRGEEFTIGRVVGGEFIIGRVVDERHCLGVCVDLLLGPFKHQCVRVYNQDIEPVFLQGEIAVLKREMGVVKGFLKAGEVGEVVEHNKGEVSTYMVSVGATNVWVLAEYLRHPNHHELAEYNKKNTVIFKNTPPIKIVTKPSVYIRPETRPVAPETKDMVNHPPHYNKLPVQCIEITRHLGFNLGNAIKYMWRCNDKGTKVQDLEKAIWYIKDEIGNIDQRHTCLYTDKIRAVLPYFSYCIGKAIALTVEASNRARGDVTNKTLEEIIELIQREIEISK